MGFDADAIERAVEAIRRVLVDGPLTRDEIAHRIREEGIGIDPGSQAPTLLIRQAALRGVVCEVAPKGGSNAYHLLEEWVSAEEPPERETALAELARRYLRAYQPASLDDFAYWSGLLKRDVRTAWETIDDDLTAVDVGGRPTAMFTADLPDRPPSRDGTVRLLPGYDTYLLGYEVDARPVPAAYRTRVWPGAGIVRPTVTVDGAVVATWRLDRSADPPTVLVEPFERFDADLVTALESEADRVGRFLGIDPGIEVSDG